MRITRIMHNIEKRRRKRTPLHKDNLKKKKRRLRQQKRTLSPTLISYPPPEVNGASLGP